MSSATSPTKPLRFMPAYSFSFTDSIRSMPRLDPIARRSTSASSPVRSPTAMPICMSCSWKIGMPRVRSSTGFSFGWAYVTSSFPSLRRTYGCTAPPWIGPGRMSAISITRS